MMSGIENKEKSSNLSEVLKDVDFNALKNFMVMLREQKVDEIHINGLSIKFTQDAAISPRLEEYKPLSFEQLEEQKQKEFEDLLYHSAQGTF